MSLERIRSVAHGRERTERTRSRENSAQAANAHIERKSVQRGSNAHHFRSKFTIPGPRFPSGVREPDFQVLAHCILAMTAEAQAFCGNIDGHRFFKLRDLRRAHANRHGQSAPRTAAPLGFAAISMAVGLRSGELLELY